MSDFGIVYISFGETYVDCTIAALKSKIANAPNTPAILLTNRADDTKSKICANGDISVKYLDMKNTDVRQVKTQVYRYSPFKKTLLLDADAWINRELSNQFKMLEFAPIAMPLAHHHPCIGTAAHLGPNDKAITLKAVRGLRYMPHYASGVIFFRRDGQRVQRLFDAWYEEWAKLRSKDQGALLRAITKTELYPMMLPNKDWLTEIEGRGFISHSFGPKLPSMPRKDRRSPRRHKFIP